MEKENINLTEEILDQEIEEIQARQDKRIRESRRKRKNIIVSAIALVLAGITLISGLLVSKKKKDKGTTNPTNSIVMEDDTVSIDDLGIVLDEDELNNNKNNKYGETTGDINKDDLVEKDGTIWKDKDAADKSDDVGKSDFDDKDGKLKEDEDGDIVDPNPGYEVQDEDGNKKDEGDGIPEGYAWDDVLGKLVKEEDVGKYVYADATYYAPDGTIIINKGDIVLKETLERAKKELTTVKPTKETTPTETTPTETTPTEPTPTEPTPTETKTDEGVVNKDGTYTIYGVTYKSKEDYQQFLLHPEQYGYYNGMILSLDEIEELFNQKQKTK